MLMAAALLGAAALLANSATAQSQDDNHAARVAAATAMYDTCGERKQLESYFEKYAELTVERARAQTPTFNDAQWKAYQAIMVEDLNKGLDDYIAIATENYAAHFTVEDIQTIAAFCRSRVGQKIAGMRAQMEADTFELRQAWMESAIRAAISDAQQKAQSEGSAL